MGADPQRKHVKIPDFLAWLIAVVSEIIAWFTGKPPLFSLYSYRYTTTTQYYSCEKVSCQVYLMLWFLTLDFVRLRNCWDINRE